MDASSFCPIYKWGQTDLDVIITVEVNEECIKSHSVSAEGKVEVQGTVPKKGDFKLILDLYGEIKAGATEARLLPRSLRLKIRKLHQGETWKSLQKQHIPKPAQVSCFSHSTQLLMTWPGLAGAQRFRLFCRQ
uniref:CS domain-containing protein n=1 Tax=Guillardia theta TaxID=55529 RepID=A0A7S4KV81_GUITH|mmetsp:Transcript_3171/g.10692  ORF Transcript_3171/g.10692 Transcript_3171/m.10692 type:complete len:133 (+) Transcript_3171:107-505(+)